MRIDFESMRICYVAWFGEQPAAVKKITVIEHSLDLTLPSGVLAGRDVLLGGVSHHCLDTGGPATIVTEDTLRSSYANNSLTTRHGRLSVTFCSKPLYW
jgi:hypothetical protein